MMVNDANSLIRQTYAEHDYLANHEYPASDLSEDKR